jgi:hypothetical protein
MYQSRIDNLETPATLVTQDTGRIQTKHKNTIMIIIIIIIPEFV